MKAKQRRNRRVEMSSEKTSGKPRNASASKGRLERAKAAAAAQAARMKKEKVRSKKQMHATIASPGPAAENKMKTKRVTFA
ncbi:hypothetical protein A0H81_04962 [Grifola frondosa]|uniref:Small EDRK-rich factor-like N-terminal domain-containing protein n=1 Tax=Grifola frondosa TaxID=5627 RepID=A0A1C7MEE9_GRIFR|nr:hypothetical protein A0H81_04962 [Grifola frondosa]